ncbi:hypothetical protein ACRJ4B_09740 [Streptomyces sp. GTA36]
MTLAELLVRLGSFGLGLTWRVEFDEIVDPRCVEMASRFADAGMDTLTLLSLTTPFLQLIDAEVRGFAGDELMLVLTEFDSSSWDVRAVDERVLSGTSPALPRCQGPLNGELHLGRSTGGSRPR